MAPVANSGDIFFLGTLYPRPTRYYRRGAVKCPRKNVPMVYECGHWTLLGTSTAGSTRVTEPATGCKFQLVIKERTCRRVQCAIQKTATVRRIEPVAGCSGAIGLYSAQVLPGACVYRFRHTEPHNRVQVPVGHRTENLSPGAGAIR